jgi:hypothetical protein
MTDVSVIILFMITSLIKGCLLEGGGDMACTTGHQTGRNG